MIINTKMLYLGLETKSSKKTGASYLLVKMMEKESSSIFEFYVPSDKLTLVTDVGQLQQFNEVGVKLKISSYNNKAQVDLEGVGK